MELPVQVDGYIASSGRLPQHGETKVELMPLPVRCVYHFGFLGDVLCKSIHATAKAAPSWVCKSAMGGLKFWCKWPGSRGPPTHNLGLHRWSNMLDPSQPVGKILRNRRTAVVVGDGHCRTLFVHAGILPGLMVQEVMLQHVDKRLVHAAAYAEAYKRRSVSVTDLLVHTPSQARRRCV